MSPAHGDGHDEPGRGFWVGLGLGGPVIAYGVVQLVRRTGWPRSLATARWLVGGLLLHDLVLVPIVLVLVWVVGRITPRWLTTPVRTGLLASALVLALGWPGLRGYGNRTDNRTVHPLAYGTAVLTALALVWAAAAAWAGWRLVSGARAPRAPGSPAGDRGSRRTSRTPAPG